MLNLFSFLSTFTLAAGAPLAPQDFLVQWVPDRIKSLSREMFIFLDLSFSPTKRQTATSCLLVIFTSILVGLGMSHSKDTINKWDAFKSRLMRLTYGLLAPDYVVMSAHRQQLIVNGIANSYNREFPTEDPTKKWSPAHGRFALEGGFVLWEDNKPTTVLKPEDLIRMIRVGDIDAPTVSKKDILAKINHFNVLTPWLVFTFIWWYGKKLLGTGFPFLTLTMMYAWSAWHAYFVRNDTMRSIRQTIPVYRKPREKYGEKEQHQAREARGKDENEIEFSDIGFDIELQCIPPSLFKLENSLSQRLELRCEDISTHWGKVSGGRYWSLAKFYIAVGFIHLPALAITASVYVTYQILHLILSILINLFGACTVPMRIQWKLMCSESTDNLDKISIGTGWIVTFVSWGMLLLNSWVVKYTSRTGQYIWRSSLIFILAQPLILWLSAPHQRWVKKLGIGKRMKVVIFCLWCLAYFAARVAIFPIAFWSLKEALVVPDPVCIFTKDGHQWCFYI